MKTYRKFHNKLIFACKKEDIVQIEEILKGKKHNLDASNGHGKPLLFACSIGNKKIVELMIKHGADVNKTHKNGKNALTVAFEKGHNQLFDFLISRGVNFNCPHGFRLLLEDCKQKEMRDFEFLLKHGAPTNCNEPNDMFPLMSATQFDCIEKVRFLLKHFSVDANKKDKNGLSCLHLACINNNQEIACLLIENGAILVLKNQKEQTCLSLAYENQEPSELVKYIIFKEPNLMNEDKEFLFQVVNRNDLPMLNYILKRGIDLNMQERKTQMTALMIAIKNELFYMAELLIKNGADLNLTDMRGNSALIWAASCNESNCLSIFKLLTNGNIDLDIQNDEGKTALMIAVNRGSLEFTHLLIKHGCQLNSLDNLKRNALFYAYFASVKQSSDNKKLLKLLMDLVDNLNHQDCQGDTLLHLACTDGKTELVRLLILNDGVNLNVQNNEGKTPLMCALKQKHLSLSEMLIDVGADLDILDKYAESVWFYLCGSSSKSLIDCHKRCLEKLAEKSDLLNKTNKRGQTPLLRAIDCKSDKWLVEFLIKKGANISHEDIYGKRALYYALNNNLAEIAELLINNGANVNEQSNWEPYLFLVCITSRIDSCLCELLIRNGANLHCKHKGERVFNLLTERSCFYNNFEMYRNALVQELSDIFNYTDYERFKQRVVESIENEEVCVIESDHLKALSLLSADKKEFERTIAHFTSLEFRERLIVDYLNVLDDHKEQLEFVKRKFINSFPGLNLNVEKIIYDRSVCFKFKELLSNGSLGYLIDFVNSQSTLDQQTDAFTKAIKSFNNYSRTVKAKIKLGRELLEFIERNL